MNTNTYWMNKVLTQLNKNLPDMNNVADDEAMPVWFDACSGAWSYITPVHATRTRATFRSLINMSFVTFYVDNNGTVRMETPVPLKDQQGYSFD